MPPDPGAGADRKAADARAFAEQRHGDQRYSGEPYVVHLTEAAAVLGRFGIADPEIGVAVWLHDVAEDTDTTIEDVAERFGARVAELVGAVTAEPGPTRTIRHAATYPKTRRVPGAVMLKLADRIANVERGGAPRAMYREEHPGFRDALHRAGEADAMWDHLDGLLAED